MSKDAVELLVEWSPGATLVWDRNSKFESPDLSRWRGKNAVLALSRRTSFVRTLRLPDVPRDQLLAVVRIKAADLFPLPAHELAVSVVPTDQVDGSGRLCVVVAAPAATVRAARASLQEAGLKIAATVPAAFGAANSLPSGSGAVVSTSVEGWGIDLIESGVLRHSRTAPLNADYTAEAGRALAALGLAGAPVHLAADAGSERAPILTLLDRRPSVDLRPPEEIAAENAARSTRAVRSGAIFLLAAVVVLVYVANDRAEQGAIVKRQIAREAAKARKTTTLKKALESDAATVFGLRKALDEAFRPGQYPTDAITAAALRRPQGLWLTGVSIERGKTLQVRGTAKTTESVAEYVRRLGAEKRFRDVKLVYSNNGEIADKPVVQFSVSAFPVGNIPALAVRKSAGSTR